MTKHSDACLATCPKCKCNTCQHDNCIDGNEACCKQHRKECPVTVCKDYVYDPVKKKPAVADKQTPIVADKQTPAVADKQTPVVADKQTPIDDDDCDF